MVSLNLGRFFKREKGGAPPWAPQPSAMKLMWDEANRPRGYILGVTPGFATRPEMAGLARKFAEASKLGFEFAEIDFEREAEILEPDVESQIKNVRSAFGMELGVHLPVHIDLCLAHAHHWKTHHDILRRGAVATRKIGGKFFLFHTSSNAQPHVTFWVGSETREEEQAAYQGQNLAEFMDDFDAGKHNDVKRGAVKKPDKTAEGEEFKGLRDWFMARFIHVLYRQMGLAGDISVLTYFYTKESFALAKEDAKKDRDRIYAKYYPAARLRLIDVIEKVAATRGLAANLQDLLAELKAKDGYEKLSDIYKTNEDILGFIIEEIRKNDDDSRIYKAVRGVREATEYHDFESVFKYFKEKGSRCDESVAYQVIAKYMYVTQDPIWLDIVGHFNPDRIIDDADKRIANYKGDSKNPSTEDLIYKMIAAVASKYIQGHLFVEGKDYGMASMDPELKGDMSVYDYAAANKVQIVIETADPHVGAMYAAEPGKLRIMHASDHVKLVRHLDMGEYICYNLDFEHLQSNLIRPEDDIKTLKDGDGKFIRMVHANAPRPAGGAGYHFSVPLASLEMFHMYKWLWLLRQKGMTNAYFIWETGPVPIAESAIAFRNFRSELIKGTPPEKLSREFYGLGVDFEQAQAVAVKSHALDPLRGLLVMPEEAHGMIGEAAAARGKGAGWKGEELK